MSYYPKTNSHMREKVKVELDLPHYTAKNT